MTKKCKVPIFADPVSCTKAARLLPSLSSLYAVTPNSLETRILTGVKPDCEEALENAVRIFLEAGIKKIFISLGADGVYVADKNESMHLRNLPCKIVNATGAGDAMMAGFAYAFVNGRSLKETALIGLAAAAISLEGSGTINEKMSEEAVLKRVGLEN